MIIFKKYFEQIYDESDKPLMEESDKAASNGALRAAYIMIWISCAESIKRRFRDAGKRDSKAGRVTTEIGRMESEHKSIDKFILDKAKEYGFLSDSEYMELLHIYNMRCVYAHPYEKAPTEEQVLYALSVVVKDVLSKPVLLREGFVKELIHKMVLEKNYIDAHESAIEQFTLEIINKIDKNVYSFLLENYWKEIERMALDKTSEIYYERGVIFTATILKKVEHVVYTEEEWLENIRRYPRTMVGVINSMSLFNLIGEKAQNALIGNMLDFCVDDPKMLNCLEKLYDEMTSRQRKRFNEYINQTSWENLNLSTSKLSLKICFEKIIDMLGSHNYYTQNPAVEYVSFIGVKGINKLEQKQQDELGRNILQAAEGGATSARYFIGKLEGEASMYPIAFLNGILEECFINESNEIRLKFECIKDVIAYMNTLKLEEHQRIIEILVEKISHGCLKYGYIAEEQLDKLEQYIDYRIVKNAIQNVTKTNIIKRVDSL